MHSSLSLLALTTLASPALASYSNFTLQGHSYTTISTSIRASEGLTCPSSLSNASCPLSAYGYAAVPPTLSVTLSASNTSAFAAFTPHLHCYPGVLTDCSAAVPNSTPVAACYAITVVNGAENGDGYLALDGV